MKATYSYFFGITFLLLPFLCFAQENITQTVRGTVVDGQSKMPLIGANVALIDGDKIIGDMTDLDGKFKIEEVSVGRHDLKASYLGYEDKVIPEVLVSSGKEVVLTIELTESVRKIDEIVVQGNSTSTGDPINSLAVVSAKSFSIEQTARYAASVDDPARLALSFAGVKGQTDIVNALIVRGNSPRYVRWHVEGLEVPDPNHFSQEGYGGGAVSILSNQVLNTSDFYTGAFPAEYGNATAALFDLRLRKGNNEKREYSLQAGMMGLQACLEGPFTNKKKASYLVNYRYSTLSLLGKIGFDIGNSVTTYQDLNMKLNFPSRKAGTFSLFAIAGKSSLEIEGNPNGENEKNKFYDMGMVGFSHSYSINTKNHLKTVLSLAANKEATDQYTISQTNKREPLWRLTASNIQARFTTQLNTKFNARNSLRSGIIISRLGFKLKDGYGLTRSNNYYKASGGAYLIQAYSQWQHRLNEAVSFTTGVHYILFTLNGSYNIEPRFGFKWQINEKQNLTIGAGLHSSLESLAYYMVHDPYKDTQPNRHLGLTKAVHGVIGYEIFPVKYLRLKSEVYYQYLYDIPIRNKPKSQFSLINFIDRYTTRELENAGLGVNYGIELTLEKIFAQNYYILANGAFFNSRYKAGDGNWYNTRYNTNFVTSLTAGKDFKVGKISKHNTIGMNARVLWSGGERTPESDYEEQIKNYFRLDLRFSYTRNKANYSWQISLDIQNTTNRYNENQLEEIDPAGILPIANYKVSF